MIKADKEKIDRAFPKITKSVRYVIGLDMRPGQGQRACTMYLRRDSKWGEPERPTLCFAFEIEHALMFDDLSKAKKFFNKRQRATKGFYYGAKPNSLAIYKLELILNN